jgi:hypothetical protein
MHYVHLVAVEAESDDEAIQHAEEAIEQYGEGDVWDWHEVGGRWDGYLDGKNVLRFSDNPAVFKQAIEGIRATRNDNIKSIIDTLSGKVIGPDEVRSSLGLNILDPEGSAQRISAYNVQGQAEFQSLLDATDYVAWAEEHVGSLMGYQLYKLGKLLAGHYASDSHFYDGVAQDPSFQYVTARVVTDPTTQWLVVMDLHN